MLDNQATSAERNTTGVRTYTETVTRGFYGKHAGGLLGKYDNVRIYWEDQLTRLLLRPFVSEAVRACAAENRGVRILDLGCGTGQGYELLTRIPEKDLNLDDALRRVLPPDKVSCYLGLDITEAMVEQGRENYRGVPNVDFCRADLRDGLGPAGREPPFDVYFSSYGALSHLDGTSLRRCLSDIIGHAAPGALVVLDLLGRYSPEWPRYWRACDEPDEMRPYSMSYLYEEGERQDGSVEQFSQRFWDGEEVRDLCRSLNEEHGVAVEVIELLDRSLFVGRHIDTGEYGSLLPPLRSVVNRLYGLNVRTKLGRLRVDYHPAGGPDALEQFFSLLAMCWNRVVDFTLVRLQGKRIDLVGMDGWREFPPALQVAIMTMDRVIDSVSWIDLGDVRANILEPQLAYVLRRLEYMMQKGHGYGHGLVAVLRVGQPRARATTSR